MVFKYRNYSLKIPSILFRIAIFNATGGKRTNIPKTRSVTGLKQAE